MALHSHIFAKPDDYLAGVASPASLLTRRCVVATKFTTSNNHPDEALLLYVHYTGIILFCKESAYYEGSSADAYH